MRYLVEIRSTTPIAKATTVELEYFKLNLHRNVPRLAVKLYHLVDRSVDCKLQILQEFNDMTNLVSFGEFQEDSHRFQESLRRMSDIGRPL